MVTGRSEEFGGLVIGKEDAVPYSKCGMFCFCLRRQSVPMHIAHYLHNYIKGKPQQMGALQAGRFMKPLQLTDHLESVETSLFCLEQESHALAHCIRH